MAQAPETARRRRRQWRQALEKHGERSRRVRGEQPRPRSERLSCSAASRQDRSATGARRQRDDLISVAAQPAQLGFKGADAHGHGSGCGHAEAVINKDQRMRLGGSAVPKAASMSTMASKQESAFPATRSQGISILSRTRCEFVTQIKGMPDRAYPSANEGQLHVVHFEHLGKTPTCQRKNA